MMKASRKSVLKEVTLLEQPKGSFRTGGGKWFIACWECIKGINGNAKCKVGLMAKNLNTGCSNNGQLLDKYKKEGEQIGDTDTKDTNRSSS
jgi:hypothetical protein